MKDFTVKDIRELIDNCWINVITFNGFGEEITLCRQKNAPDHLIPENLNDLSVDYCRTRIEDGQVIFDCIVDKGVQNL